MSNRVLPAGMCRSDEWVEDELFNLGMRVQVLSYYLSGLSSHLGSPAMASYWNDMVVSLREISSNISDVRADFIGAYRSIDCNTK